MSDRREGVYARISAVWGVQVASSAAQLTYGVFTSRLLDATAFGIYATALAVASALSIVINSGLGAAAARRQDESEQGDRALVAASLVVGVLAAVGLALAAVPIASLWRQPEAVPLLILMALPVLFWPFTGVAAGILRRLGQIAVFNWVTLSAVLVSLALSAALVLATRSAWSLAMAQVVGAILTAAGFALALGRRGRPAWPKGIRSDLVYALKYSVLSVGAVINNVVPLWVVGRFCGADVLGNWNRAQAMGRTPVDGLIRAGIIVVFPRFRFDRPEEHDTVSSWTVLNAAAAWYVVPVGMTLTPIIGPLLLLLLGDGWQTASQIVGFLWVGGVALILSSLLATALESAGAMRIAGWGRLTSSAVIIVTALATAATGAWLPVAIGMAVSQVLVQIVQVVMAGRAGYLRTATLVMWYAAALGVGLLLWMVVVGATRMGLPPIPIACLTAMAYLAGILASRRSLGPLRGP